MALALTTEWHSGTGSQLRSQLQGCARGDRFYVAKQHRYKDRNNELKYCYKYASFVDYPQFAQSLLGSRSSRYYNEVLPLTDPVLPYAEFDDKGFELTGVLTEKRYIIQEVEQLLTRAFKSLYDVDLVSEDFHWCSSYYPQKLSLHMTIWHYDHRGLLAFRGTEEAIMTVKHLFKLDPRLEPYLDHSVYNKNSLMRMVGSCKQGKEDYPLRMVKGLEDRMVITKWANEPLLNILVVPSDAVLVRHYDSTVASRPKSGAEGGPTTSNTAVVMPVNQLEREYAYSVIAALQYSVHSSFKYQNYRQDARTKTHCLLYNHHQLGHCPVNTLQHHDNRNMMVKYSYTGQITMYCGGANCVGVGGKTLDGYLKEKMNDAALHVNARYITNARRDDPEFSSLVDEWSSRFDSPNQCLAIKSGLGTGKTELITQMVKPLRTVLVICCRTSLCENCLERFSDGFILYSQIDGSIADRQRYPKVIVCLDSIGRLCSEWSPAPTEFFNTVIIDEIRSVLLHLSASTLQYPMDVIRTLHSFLGGAQRILASDGMFDLDCYHFFESIGRPIKLVINDYMPVEHRRTFKFGMTIGEAFDEIVELLKEGKNVVAPSLSSKVCEKLIIYVKDAKIPGISENDLLMHIAEQADEVKRTLKNVNILWKTKRLVTFSPCVDTGVDFNLKHFHSVFSFINSGAAGANAVVQQNFRVRHLENPIVNVVYGNGVSTTGSPCTSQFFINMAFWVNSQNEGYYKELCERIKTAFPESTVSNLTPLERHKLIQQNMAVQIFARNAAVIRNSQTNLVGEIKRLLLDGGHQVEDYAPPEPKKKKPKRSQTEEEVIQIETQTDRSLRLVWDDEQYKALKHVIATQQASTNDKKLFADYKWLESHGLNRITEEFLDQTQHSGVSQQPGNPKRQAFMWLIMTDQMKLYLRNKAQREQEGLVDCRNAISRVDIVAETLRSLGLDDIYDSKDFTITAENRSMKLFEQHQRYHQLFSVSGNPPTAAALNIEKMAKLVRLMFGYFGITLDSKQKQIEGDRKRYFTINQNSVSLMTELLKAYVTHKAKKTKAVGVELEMSMQLDDKQYDVLEGLVEN